MISLERACRVIACSAALVVAACGGGGLRLGDVTPQAVPSLEAARAQRPQDPAVLTRLGVAYFRAGRLGEARQILDSVTVRDPRNGIAAIYRGMTAEAQGDFPAASSSYQTFIAVARSRELKNLARQRLALIGRRELEYQARLALAQEAQLGQTPPEANTIAVMPFAYTGTNEDIQPLSRGFAQLVVTDLAKSRQVRVLERERMQAMLDELHLGEQGRVDSTTAARGGRLLRAERVVQGALGEQGSVLRVDATVVTVATTGVAPGAQAADQLSRIFDLEKSLVIQLFQNLGIQLSEAERQAINQRPTQNLQAFLAWSRGLAAEDAGDFARAQQFYDQATRIDPGFLTAQQSSAKAADMSAAAATSVQSVDASVTQNASAETGPAAGTSQQAALSNGTNGVTPATAAPQSGEQTTTTNQPNADKKQSEPILGTPTSQPTGTIIIRLVRP